MKRNYKDFFSIESYIMAASFFGARRSKENGSWRKTNQLSGIIGES